MAFCSKCGTQLMPKVAFCSACGAAAIASAQSSQSAQPSVTSANIDEALEIFVGKNYDYYKRKWGIIIGLNKSHNSWNWAAFFFVVFWMPYRKMYLYSFVYLSALIIETLFEYAVKIPNTSVLSYAINIAISVMVGLYGNYWYKFHAEKRVKEIIATNTPERVKIELARQGGTSIVAVIGYTILLLAAAVLVTVVGEQHE